MRYSAMDGTRVFHFCLRWTIRMAVCVLILLVLLAAALLVIASHLRDPLIHFLSDSTNRHIQVAGRFEANLLSLHPHLTAERVEIGNPPWTAPGITAEIGRLTVAYDLPLLGHSFAIHSLVMEGATLHLLREANGHANWQWREPGTGRGSPPPLIHSLRMPNAHVTLDDRRRQLRFDGTVTAADVAGSGDIHPLRIQAAGELNGRAANLLINADPLATVRVGQPYHFTFSEDSSGTVLTGQGFLPQPFDFHYLETTFDSKGEDMKDLYFLTGVHLPDTGVYRFSGKLTRDDSLFEFSDLQARSGESDVTGKLSIETHHNASRIDADLRSERLRLVDLGPQAAGRPPDTPATPGIAPGKPAAESGGAPLLVPDTPFRLEGLRQADAGVTFHARQVVVGRVTLHAVVAKVSIADGVASAKSLSASLSQGLGHIAGEIKLDMTHDMPAADLDLRISDLHFGQFARKKTGDEAQPAPLDGPMQARIRLKGRGRSLHQLASTADGTATAILPHGDIRASMAELAGVDLRGLGLMATHDQKDTEVRCAIASFQVKDGVFTTDSLLIDTEPVLITGRGDVRLDSESLDLTLQGRPKHPRLRLRAPLLVHGTLRHPSVSLQAGKPAVQAGAAIALGVLLTPVAAILAFVDPGLAKDTDCSALLAQGKAEGVHESN